MSNSRPLAAILTLGCKLNLADSEEIARGLRANGFAVVDRMCEADAYVINTCSVTHVADRKSRRLVRSVRRLAPEATVAVTGCFPQSAGFEAAQALGADYVTGMRDADKANLVSFLKSRPRTLSYPHSSSFAPHSSLHTRAFIKAQEGCDDVCAFCIVPRTRGREESRSIERVVADVKDVVANGTREVVVTGTQLGAWGRDLDRPLKPHHLIGSILDETEVARLRFSSLQPQDITPELLACWSDPRLMPHFHLALQSGSEDILASMRRRYTAREFIEAAARIRAAVPDAAITTDVIAGFPGETRTYFEATLALCEEVAFARIHAFPYSQRFRTAAARMPDQVGSDIRKGRMTELISLAEELSRRFRRRFVGTVRPVLWESERETAEGARWFGHTDNYMEVLAAGEGLRNRITPAQLIALYDDGMTGSVASGVNQ
jgi:threonylcarbamoyladenosine tRNA methylthiotransferase MtaB